MPRGCTIAFLILCATQSPAVAQDPQSTSDGAAARVRTTIVSLAAAKPADRRAACASLPPLWPESARAVPALIEMTEWDESEEVRRAATDALREIGERGALEYAARLDDIRPHEKKDIEDYISMFERMGPNWSTRICLGAAYFDSRSALLIAPFIDPPTYGAAEVAAGIAPVFETKNPRHRSFVAAALGALAAMTAAREAPAPDSSRWSALGARLLGSGTTASEFAGLVVHARIVKADEPRLLIVTRLADILDHRSCHAAVAAAARAAPVSPAVRSGLIAHVGIGCMPLAVHRERLGFGADLVSALESAPSGADGDHARNVGRRLQDRDARFLAALDRQRTARSFEEERFWCGVAWDHSAGVLQSGGNPAKPAAARLAADPSDREAAHGLAECVKPGNGLRSWEVSTAWDAIASLGLEAAGVPRSSVTHAVESGLLRPNHLNAIARLGSRTEKLMDSVLVGLAVVRKERELALQYSGEDAELARTLWSDAAVAAHLRVLAAAGPAAASALPTVREYTDDPFPLTAHCARTAIRRIATK